MHVARGTRSVCSSYDTRKLVFGMPDANGFVTFTGPAGTLPPGTQVLVVNEGTGEVASFTADNDGAISGSLLASIRDRLLVTITDPLGNVITFERGEYRAPDGTTAVNSAGGIVTDASCSAGLEACPGVELRIPPAATEDAVVMQLKALALSLLPEGPLPDLTLPDGQVAQLASALEIKSDGTPTFNQPVDLVFPKPATAPDGASYFVVRRLTGPNGLVAYETVDVAKVEGEGADAKIVTASEPFSGYLYTQPGFSLTGLDPSGAMGTQFVNTAILYWAFDEALPGRPLGGAITGRVLRVTWNPGSPTPEYEPVAGALVSGVDVTGEPLWATARPGESAGPNVAVSQADGTYALIDLHYQGGPVTIAARINGETKTATAFQANPQDLKSPGLQFVRHVAVADITFPAVAPPPPAPALPVKVFTEDAEGRRIALASGVVVAGTPVIIGTTASDLTIRGAEISGGGLTATPHGMTAVTNDPSGLTWLVQPNFTPPQPGTYTVTIIGQPAFGADLRASVTFRAVATAGGSLDPIAPDPPAVITARLVPKPNATGVSVAVYPQVAFTEPVKNVANQVTLTDGAGAAVPFSLLGVGPDGPVDNVTAETVVTSLTLVPTTGLKYATRYTLRLTDQIVDLDAHPTTGEPEPHNLAPFESSFTTFEPTALGGTEEQFTAGGLAILGDRAYVAENRGRTTNVRLYDVSDPTTPLEITGEPTGNFALTVPPPVLFPGHPADLVAEENSPLTSGPVIAVATTNLTYPYQPSNVRLYDVSDDQTWRWIGAVTLGTSPVDGQIQRIALRGELLYAVTAGVGKGIQVVDLAKAREIFNAQTANGEADPMFWEMQQRLGLEGQGFAQEAVVQTIFLDTGTGQNSLQRGLAVIDLNVDGITQPIVVATGRTPLSTVNPQTGEVLYNGPICAADAPICDATHALTSWGWTIAAGVVQGRPLAFVTATPPTGISGDASILAVIDLTNPRLPVALGAVAFSGLPSGQSMVLRGEMLHVGTATGTVSISVADPTRPVIAGTTTGVAGRLVMNEDHLLFGILRQPSVTHEFGGLRAGIYGRVLLVTPRSFLSTDTLTAKPVPSTATESFTWRITPALGGVKNETPADRTGPTFSFAPDPGRHKPYVSNQGGRAKGNGSLSKSHPLVYGITATSLVDGELTGEATQDEVDVIRQEYVNHRSIGVLMKEGDRRVPLRVPERSEFHAPVETLHFKLKEMNQTAYGVILGQPGELAERIRAEYNKLIYDDRQEVPVGRSGLDPSTVIVSAGTAIEEFGTILDTPKCYPAPDPETCDDVYQFPGDDHQKPPLAILAGPNGVADTAARNEVTDFGILLNSAWRNPQRNEWYSTAGGGVHQYGDGVDLMVPEQHEVRLGRPKQQLVCTLLTAARRVLGLVAWAETPRTVDPVPCNWEDVNHVHVGVKR